MNDNITSKPEPGLNPGWNRVYINDEPQDEFEYCEPVASSLSLRTEIVRRDEEGWFRAKTQLTHDGRIPPRIRISAAEVGQLVGKTAI